MVFISSPRTFLASDHQPTEVSTRKNLDIAQLSNVFRLVLDTPPMCDQCIRYSYRLRNFRWVL